MINGKLDQRFEEWWERTGEETISALLYHGNSKLAAKASFVAGTQALIDELQKIGKLVAEHIDKL